MCGVIISTLILSMHELDKQVVLKVIRVYGDNTGITKKLSKPM